MKRENNYSQECLGLLNTAVLVKASEMLRKELRAGRTSPSLRVFTDLTRFSPQLREKLTFWLIADH